MVESVTGQGEALDATVAAQDGDPARTESDEEAAKRKAEALDVARRALAGAQAKVERQQQHLEGAMQAVVEAEARLSKLEADEEAVAGAAPEAETPAEEGGNA